MPNESIEDSGFLAACTAWDYGEALPCPCCLGHGLVVGSAAHVAGLLSVDWVGLSWWAVSCGLNV